MIRSRPLLTSALAAPLTALVLFLTAIRPAEADLNARSAILMDVNSKQILYAQNSDVKIAPASLTKIMTMYVALDHINSGRAKLNDRAKISKHAAGQRGSRMYIKEGEDVSLDLLLLGVAVSSGNDAAVALAEHLSGSVERFVKLMNAKAAELGMGNTSFRNPNGLPATGQLTTARDMLTLARYYLKNHPEALKYHSTLQLTHNGVLTTNKNPLFKTCPGTDGLKTGWTRASGFNLVATGTRDNHRLLGVVMGAPTPKAMGGETLRLMESGYLSVSSADRTAANRAAHKISLRVFVKRNFFRALF